MSLPVLKFGVMAYDAESEDFRCALLTRLTAAERDVLLSLVRAHLGGDGSTEPAPIKEAQVDAKIGKVRRWNVLRSEIQHRGFLWWLFRKLR